MTTDQLNLFATAAAPETTIAVADSNAALLDAAHALPKRIRLGTSSWSYPGWNGLVYGGKYTQAQLAAHGLSAYSRHPLLRTVGIDRTYYGPITAEAFASYAASVPEDFRFLVKAHELCTIHRYPTHPRYGALGGTYNGHFLDAAYATEAVVAPAVAGLGPKLGPLLFQFTPQDVAALGGSSHFAPALAKFLGGLPVGPLYAVEIRNAELFTPRYIAALVDAGAVHCFNVHPTMQPIATQARVTASFAGKPLVVRWQLHDGYTYESGGTAFKPFDAVRAEDPDTRSAIAQLVANTKDEAFVIINNNAEGCAPLSSLALARLLTGK